MSLKYIVQILGQINMLRLARQVFNTYHNVGVMKNIFSVTILKKQNILAIMAMYIEVYPLHNTHQRVKVGVLRPVQQPGSYWDRSSELPLVGLEPTEVTAYD